MVKNILIFDTETTGLPKDDKAYYTDVDNWPRLVQLAWIVADRNGESVRERSVIIQPDGFEIHESATAVHGITTQRAQDEGLCSSQVFHEFHDALVHQDVGLVVAHNYAFDYAVLCAELYRAQDYVTLSSFEETLACCTMKRSTEYCRIPKPGGRSRLEWPRLQELHMKLFGHEFECAHDALNDARACMRCYFELVRRGVLAVSAQA